jgi:hypothetical protein
MDPFLHITFSSNVKMESSFTIFVPYNDAPLHLLLDTNCVSLSQGHKENLM